MYRNNEYVIMEGINNKCTLFLTINIDFHLWEYNSMNMYYLQLKDS